MASGEAIGQEPPTDRYEGVDKPYHVELEDVIRELEAIDLEEAVEALTLKEVEQALREKGDVQ